LGEPLQGWRFEPKPTAKAIAAVVLLSLGGLALGVGVYGQWLRGAEVAPLGYAPALLVGGLLMLGGYALLARAAPPVLQVGDVGLSVEPGTGAERRIAWYDITAIRLGPAALRVEAKKESLLLPLAEHAAAARRVVAEAGERIPKRLELRSADRARLGEADPSEGQSVAVEAPQVAGLSCRASGKPLTFEHDVRLCARCFAAYDQASVPLRCLGCDAELRT
jgi:hypothetical protein